METKPSILWPIALPTLILLSLSTDATLSRFRPYREVFGNGDCYLDLYYDANPRGWLRSGDRVRFRGTWTTESGESEISGVREGSRYSFDAPTGKFTASLRRSDRGCEPALQFRWRANRAAPQSGTLKAGFCYGS